VTFCARCRRKRGIEAYAPTDNVPELSARTDGEGRPAVFSEWLRASRAAADDGIFVPSVRGGMLAGV